MSNAEKLEAVSDEKTFWEKFMETPCNVTALESQTQMDSSLYHLIKLISLCFSCALNALLSIPLFLAITRPPSLLRHARFLLLTHLLCCDNLQLLLWTVKAVLLISKQGIPVAQCMAFCAAAQACSIVDLLLSTALAVDRCVAIKCPLRYDLLVCPLRQRAAVVAIWTSSAVVSIVALCLGLYTVQVNASLPRCRTLIFAPCLSGTSALLLFCKVGSGVLLPVCYLTILGCFLLLCWDTRGGLLRTRKAGVTLALQASQTIFYSVPMILDSYLIPAYMRCDGLDIAITTIYNLGIPLIPFVYGYRSRELRQRILQAVHRNQVSNNTN